MPRGKNYVNNNRGLFLQASKKGNESMEKCFYGVNCTRKDCVYRHETTPKSSNTEAQSLEPCMAFLSGMCPFQANQCRKRHPTAQEKATMIEQYQRIPCRYGVHCKTKGCLFQHSSNDGSSSSSFDVNNGTLFPPLLGSRTMGPINDAPPPLLAGFGAWKPAPPVVPTPPPPATLSSSSSSSVQLNIHAKEFVPGR